MTVDKITFDAFIAKRCSSSTIDHPRTERDGEFFYECYDDAEGAEVAFISWQASEPTYIIRDAE